jgi:hypothetical protein
VILEKRDNSAAAVADAVSADGDADNDFEDNNATADDDKSTTRIAQAAGRIIAPPRKGSRRVNLEVFMSHTRRD